MAEIATLPKKRPASKPGSKTASARKDIKKPLPKKAAAKKPIAKKTAPAKKTSSAKTESAGRDKFNFLNGSFRSRVAPILIKGGASYEEVVANVKSEFAKDTTRNGNPVGHSLIIREVIEILKGQGYDVRETSKSWKMVASK